VRQTPLLILAYNRPDKVRGLIDRLRPLAPTNVMVVVDGPKPGKETDAVKVAEVQASMAGIDWPATVQTRFRPVNIGLRASVVDAVSWATSEFGQAIVIEEDVLPGPDFLPYAEHMLGHYRDDDRIGHISGYNVVPPQRLANGAEHSRLTAYPESIAWATWDRAWDHYDDDLTWALSCSLADLKRVTGSTAAALRWKQNFHDAHAGRISTWAYRWIASMWAKEMLILSPNYNLVTYAGQDEGTHTLMKPAWQELPLYDGPPEALLDTAAHRDIEADRWVSDTVFAGTTFGVARGTLFSAALGLRQLKRKLRS
jgi:hypothetical protein